MTNSVASKNLQLAQRLHYLVREHPNFEVLLGPTKHLYCFRYVPNSLSDRREEPEIQCELDCLNEEIVAAIRHSGRTLVTTTILCGRTAIRMSIFSTEISEADIDSTFELIARWGSLLSPNNKHTPIRVEESYVQTYPVLYLQ
jgi:glutamate/tyrosine decarboxylase-like PLP-dependent enzyme